VERQDVPSLTQYEAAVKLQSVFRGLLGRRRPRASAAIPVGLSKPAASEVDSSSHEEPINLDDDDGGYLDQTHNSQVQ
jgi:hypothetical protein